MPDLQQAVDPARDHIRGPEDAAVTLVEYGDFQCGSCAEARVAVDEAVEELGDRVRLVFRHLPVPRSHPRAVAAALVAEAAAQQGAFWDMHARLFAHQDELSRGELLDHARALDLDVDRVADVLDNETAGERIEEDVDSALRSGAAATPTFFVDGRRLDEGWSDGGLLAALRARLETEEPA